MSEKRLYEHLLHVHHPINVNRVHASEKASSFNTRLAVSITKATGTMFCAYSFAVLALIGLLSILGFLSPIVVLLVSWASQTFLQLTFLPILSIGQSVLSRHSELQSDEAYKTTIKMYHDVNQVVMHQNAQDEKLIELSSAANNMQQEFATIDERMNAMEVDIATMGARTAEMHVLIAQLIESEKRQI
jgi:hypothetical protein